jgi:hypothetical protein
MYVEPNTGLMIPTPSTLPLGIDYAAQNLIAPMLETTPRKPPKAPGAAGAYTPPSEEEAPVYTPELQDPTPPFEEVAEMALDADEQKKFWDDQTAARQWQPTGTIEDLKAKMGLVVHDDEDGPASRYTPRTDPDAHLPEAFRGKHYRGGKQVPGVVHQSTLAEASARAKSKGQTGAYSPSRTPPSQDVSVDYVRNNESEPIQRQWFETRATQLGIDRAQAGVDTERARADLIGAEADEANLPYEQRIQRQLDSMFQMHDSINERMMPNIKDQVDKQMALIGTTPEGLKMLQDPALKKSMEAKYFRQFQQENFTKMMGMIAQLFAMNINDPQTAGNIAIENQRQSMFSGAPGAIPTTP